MKTYQKTVAQPIKTSGIGLHSGWMIWMTILPAPINTGIIFRRVDVYPPTDIPCILNNTTQTPLSTTISNGVASISTIEHLMAAFSAFGISNVVVEVSGPEIPIMDGSAALITRLIEQSGIIEQLELQTHIRILHPIEVSHDDKFAGLYPTDGGRTFNFTIDFDHPAITEKQSSFEYQLGTKNIRSFAKNIANARTFGFMKDFKQLRAQGLIKGGSFANAIVLDDERVMNGTCLRHDNELVRHKILDAIGDLYVVGCPIQGAYVAHKAGHTLTNKLLHQMYATPTAWEQIT